MLIGRFLHFRCDFCKQSEYVSRFPKGWVWIKRGIGNSPGHACQKCVELVPVDDRRNAGEKN